MQPYPTKLERQDGGQLVIEWSDGARRQYSFRELRDSCPCATCREKRKAPPPAANPFAILKPEEIVPLAITGMRPVGQYAYSIEFSDGHDTGIFSFDYLRELGATEVIERAQLSAAGKPLQKERWAGVIDSVGSHTLANACAQLRNGGVAVACGLAQGMDFPATVAPFILRGASLIGVDSVMCRHQRRVQAWQHLADEISRPTFAAITREIALADAFEAGRAILAGEIRGRVVVNVNQ